MENIGNNWNSLPSNEPVKYQSIAMLRGAISILADHLCPRLYDNGLLQLLVDAVSSVLYRDSAAAPAAGNHRDRLTAVAAKGEQKGVQLFILGVDPLNGVYLAFFCFRQIHTSSPVLD